MQDKQGEAACTAWRVVARHGEAGRGEPVVSDVRFDMFRAPQSQCEAVGVGDGKIIISQNLVEINTYSYTRKTNESSKLCKIHSL